MQHNDKLNFKHSTCIIKVSGYRRFLYFESLGYNLGIDIDTPYSGTIVPMSHFRTEKRVLSIMLEVNRGLYLNEDYSKNQNFDLIQKVVNGFLGMVREVG
jgi:hypothetical protein